LAKVGDAQVVVEIARNHILAVELFVGGDGADEVPAEVGVVAPLPSLVE